MLHSIQITMETIIMCCYFYVPCCFKYSKVSLLTKGLWGFLNMKRVAEYSNYTSGCRTQQDSGETSPEILKYQPVLLGDSSKYLCISTAAVVLKSLIFCQSLKLAHLFSWDIFVTLPGMFVLVQLGVSFIRITHCRGNSQ